MDGYGEGLDESAFLCGNVVGEFVAEILGGCVESCESSIIWWCGCEAHVDAEVIFAEQAWLAVSAWSSGLNGDSVADFEGLNFRSDFDDGAGRFVSQDHGGGKLELTNATFDPVVDIAATDAGVVYGDKNIARVLDCWLWPFLEGDIEGFVEDEGEVLLTISCMHVVKEEGELSLHFLPL